jgi:hypothetical protein
LAEHGATTKEIQAVSGHRTLTEIDEVHAARLASAALARLPDKK